MSSLRLVPSFAACLVVSTSLFAVVSIGCEPLHRDIDPVWEADAGQLDASADDAAGDDADQNGDIDANGDCVPGEACGPCGVGEITCDNDEPLCEGAADLDVHNEHCGECDNACSTDVDGAVAVCQSGECTAECSNDEESYCQGRDICVNLDENDEHCGACGADCETEIDGAEAYCEGGVCIRECPDDSQTACEDAGICVDLDSDPDHCGECDSECATEVDDTDAVCVDGNCQINCVDDAETFCEDEELCADLDTSEDHCGECGDECATDIDGAQAECVDGDCNISCVDDSDTLCEDQGVCTDLQSDDQNCNECGNSCPGPQDCVSGQCTN